MLKNAKERAKNTTKLGLSQEKVKCSGYYIKEKKSATLNKLKDTISRKD